jgi:preprotein translocase subunit SecY
LRDRGDFTRRLAITAVALIVYRLGTHIPLPGLDSHALALLYGSDGTAVERISIVALGIYPLVSVLILAELAKFLVQPLRRWERADVRNRDNLNRWIVLLAIGAAVVQATGYAGALEGVTQLVAEPGVPFRVACAGTIVAGTAFVIWLADQITRHGIGSGVWLLFVVPTLADLPKGIWALLEVSRQGQISTTGVLACALYVVLAIAALAAIMQAARATPQAAAACLWPTLITYMLLPWVLIITGLAVTGGDPTTAATWVEPGSALRIVALAGLLGLFVHLCTRPSPTTPQPWPPIAAWIVLTAITVSAEVLPAHFGLPVPVQAEKLIVIALVAMLVLSAWRSPQREKLSLPA